MITEDVVIRESKGGIIICLDSQGSFLSLKEQILNKLDSIDELIGVQAFLDVGQRKLSRKESNEIKNLLMERGLHLKKLVSRGKLVDFKKESVAEESKKLTSSSVAETNDSTAEDTIMIRRTLRSGQKIFHPGNIVIIGDVNPGAEVIAGGNVLVMGTVRGLAHAGALGSEKAIVAAFRLNPTQLRIGKHITRPPEGEGKAGKEPEMASIKSGKVVIENFKV